MTLLPLPHLTIVRALISPGSRHQQCIKTKQSLYVSPVTVDYNYFNSQCTNQKKAVTWDPQQIKKYQINISSFHLPASFVLSPTARLYFCSRRRNCIAPTIFLLPNQTVQHQIELPLQPNQVPISSTMQDYTFLDLNVGKSMMVREGIGV